MGPMSLHVYELDTYAPWLNQRDHSRVKEGWNESEDGESVRTTPEEAHDIFVDFEAIG